MNVKNKSHLFAITFPQESFSLFKNNVRGYFHHIDVLPLQFLFSTVFSTISFFPLITGSAFFKGIVNSPFFLETIQFFRLISLKTLRVINDTELFFYK